MAITNFETKEIYAKVVYFGAKGSGKSANLRSLLKQTSVELKSGMLDLHMGSGSDFYFDFLPLKLDDYEGFQMRLHLYTLPQLSSLTTTSSLMLRGLDGFVFVIDARVEALMENNEAFEKFKRLLNHEGMQLSNLFGVYQYNKRDLNHNLPVERLREIFNPQNKPEIEAVAHQNIGTMETLAAIREQLVFKMKNYPV